MVKRAKAAMFEEKAKEMAPAAVRRDRAEKRSSSVGDDKAESGAAEEPSTALTSMRTDGVGFGLGGCEKPWSIQGVVQGQGKDRGVSPPPLPVPIASFNT